MKDKKKNKPSLLIVSAQILFLPVAILTLMIAITIIFTILYNYTNLKGYLISLIVVSAIFAITYTFLIIYVVRKLKSAIYDDLYKKTLINAKKISQDDVNLEKYSNTKYEEINELDLATQEVKDKLNSSILVSTTFDYDLINLEYIDKEKSLISYDELKKKMKSIIFISQSYRNVVIEVYYNLKKSSLDEENKNYLLELYSDVFKGYQNKLFAFSNDNTSLYIYLPVIDSFSRIKEQLEMSINYSSIMISTINGREKVNAYFSIVAYPFSHEEFILNDLKYAKRQKQIINLFLPNRQRNNLGQNVLMSTTMNLNQMSKILTNLSQLEYSSIDNEKNIEMMKRLFEDICHYLDISDAGIIKYSDETQTYNSYFTTDGSVLFKGTNNISRSFVKLIEDAADDDGSYYFSNRRNANNKLAMALDYYDISSGYYYVIKDLKGITIAIIYMCNRGGKTLRLTSYLRESLFIMSLRIAHYFEKMRMLDYQNLRESENEYLLSISKYTLYRVDDDLNIVWLSNDMNKVFKNAKVGLPCHKALFNSDKMCKDCPLRTFKKKSFSVNNKYYESSLTFNDRKTHQRSILIENITKNAEVSDLFEKDYLTYSNKAFVKMLEDEYNQRVRGYVLLLSIDNADKFIEKQGSEGYLFATRNFIRKIKNKLKTNEVYIYNPTTLAIHFPLIGHIDIIDKCEQIYEISKQNYFDDGTDEDKFVLTYYPVGYPRGYATEEDFLRHIKEIYISDKFEKNKDYIYFYSYPIKRSASKREYIISVIKKEFSSLTSQSVNLQPIVNVFDKRIYGAEILLRIVDENSNLTFNAQDISRIAEQENMTHLITDSIINFVGNMYKEYGNNLFKINNFNRVAINIDNTYLNDISLIRNVVKLVKENNLPRNFISFEIPEDMVANNLANVAKFAKELSQYDIYLSVDRYMGSHITVAKLKEIGFNEIKIARDLIIDIEKDTSKFKDVQDMVNDAKKYGINVAAVGVENLAQYDILKGLDNKMLVQGYYLYKPLTRSDLIAALVSYEK